MLSERRLHPSSFVFHVAGHLKELLLPGLVVIFTAGSTGRSWETWLMLLVIPYTVIALGRSLSYRYRFDESEMVVRTGFVFRNERRIPYARIQSVDAVQRLLHRLLGVVEVRVQTGAGAEPEATMRVLPLPALREMRAHVAAQKGELPAGTDAVPALPRQVTTVLKLPLGDLLLSGFIENRGAVLIATGFGVLWEFGLMDRLMGAVFGDGGTGRGFFRQVARALLGRQLPSMRYVAISILAFAALLVLIRLLSMLQSVVKLYNFTLTRDGEELRVEYGLFTRVTSTIPLRRIQLLTVTEAPLHRVFSRVAVRVDTAGGEAAGQGTAQREALAPIVRRDQVSRLLAEVLPGIPVTDVSWHPVAPGAVRREFNRTAVLAILISLACTGMLGVWTLLALAVLLCASAFFARRSVAALGWVAVDGAVLFRSGWLWRSTSVTRFSRIQTVRLAESPFDRRTGMARVKVDTAGAAHAAHGIDIPYLPLETARSLSGTLVAHAARTTFKW